MRFLCKKCGAQSPGDLSGIEVRDGALVFVCTSCGTSATLVAAKPAAGDSPPPPANAPFEKGVVEPDEDELVDLGEATLSRMLGKKVRIVAEPESADETPAPPAPEAPPEAAGPVAAEEVLAAEAPGAPQEPFSVPEEPAIAAEAGSSRKRLLGLVAAGVVMAAVVGFALLEARQPSSKESGLVAASAPAKDAATPPNSAGPEPGVADPAGPVAAAPSPSAAPSAGQPKQEPPAPRDEESVIEVKELAPARTEASPALAPPAPASGDQVPAEVLDAAFWRVRPGVRMCATQEQRRAPDTPLGEEAVSVTFGPSGEVTGVAFERKELEGTPLGACLATEVRKVRLEPAPGRPLTVRRVFALSRSSSN